MKQLLPYLFSAITLTANAQLQVTSMSIDAPQFNYANGTLVQNCQKEICITVYNNSSSTINRGVRLYLMQGSTQVGEILAHAFQLGAFQSLTICPNTSVVGISAFNGLGGNATSAPGNYSLRLVARTYAGSPSTYDLGLVYIGDPGSADAGGSNNQVLTMVVDATGNCNQGGLNCNAGILSVSQSPLSICPDQTFDVTTDGSESTTGGFGLAFFPQSGATGGIGGEFSLVDVSLPNLGLDSDLGGLLSANSFPPLSGNWAIYTFAYADVNDPSNVCSTSADSLLVNFLDASSPLCQGGGCADPIAGAATAISAVGATLNWSGGTAPYNVEYKTSASSTWTSVNPGSSTFTTLNGLACNTTYNWRVKATCSSTWVNGSNFTTNACPPTSSITVTSPISGILTQGGATSVTWTSSNVASNAPVTIQVVNCQNDNVVATLVDGSITNSGSYSWANINLSPGQYRIKIYITNNTQVNNIGSGCFTVSATPSALELTGCITVNPTSPVQGSAMTATATVTNTGGIAWSGDVVLQLLSAQGAYITDLDLESGITIQPNGTVQLNFSTTSVTSPPGNYQVRVQYQANGTSTWTDVPQASCTNPVNLAVLATPSALELTGCITVNPTSPVQGSAMTATATVTNTGGTAWSGEVVLQLLTDQGAYLTDLDLESGVTIQPNGTVVLNFSTASVTSAPGNYQLRVQYQATGTSTWVTVPQGSCINPVNLAVQGAAGDLMLSGCITINPSTAIQGGALSVSATVQNTSGASWSGNLVMQLLTDQGAYLTDLDLQNTTLQTNGTQVLTFSTANVVSQPGTYQIRIQYQTGGSGAWLTVAAGSCVNPETLTVIASGGLRLTSDISVTAPQFSLADGTLVEGCDKDVSFTITNTSASPITRGIQLFLMDASNSTVVTNIFAHAFTLGAGQSVTFDPSTPPVGINSFNGLGGIASSAPDSYNLLLKSYVTTDAPSAFDLWLVTYAASFDVPTESCGGCVNPQPINIVSDATGNCNSPVSIHEDAAHSDSITIYPNPVTDGQLHLSGLSTGTNVITLSDMQGRSVMQLYTAADNALMNVSELPKGVYIATVYNTNAATTVHHRVVKTN